MISGIALRLVFLGSPVMRLIPYQSLTLVSPRRPAEVASLLSSIVFPALEKLDHPKSGRSPFMGQVSGDTFKLVMKRTGVINSFSPVLTGRTESSPSGTMIHMRMSPNLGVIVSMTVWFVMLGAVVAVGVRQFLLDREATFLITGVSMGLFVWLLWLLGFWWDARRAEQIIRRVLQATRLPAPTK
jgi:hypothetical protein